MIFWLYLKDSFVSTFYNQLARRWPAKLAAAGGETLSIVKRGSISRPSLQPFHMFSVTQIPLKGGKS